MLATNLLSEEHKMILAMLECIKAFAAEMAASRKFDLEMAETFHDFIENFSDHIHHCKEEDELFVMMANNGFPTEDGPVKVMKMDHEKFRGYLQDMKSATLKAAQGDDEALNLYVERADSLADELKGHVEKEDHCLYPMADQALDEACKKTLYEKFLAIDGFESGALQHKKYLSLLEVCCKRFEVNFDARADLPQIIGLMG